MREKNSVYAIKSIFPPKYDDISMLFYIASHFFRILAVNNRCWLQRSPKRGSEGIRTILLATRQHYHRHTTFDAVLRTRHSTKLSIFAKGKLLRGTSCPWYWRSYICKDHFKIDLPAIFCNEICFYNLSAKFGISWMNKLYTEVFTQYYRTKYNRRRPVNVNDNKESLLTV